MNLLSRRQMLNRTGLLGSPLVVGAVPIFADFAKPTDRRTLRKPKVIVTGGHPGDPEYGCGGTIARYTDLGHEVVLLYLNRGEWPPRDAGLSRESRRPRKRVQSSGLGRCSRASSTARPSSTRPITIRS